MSQNFIQYPFTTQKSPEEWVDLYLEMVVSNAYASGHYRSSGIDRRTVEDDIRRTSGDTYRQFVDAVLTEDMHGVLDVIQDPSMNPQGRRLFTLMTGVVLPRTIKGTINTVNSWMKGG